MSHSHFELDENFNFVEEGEEVANEEIAAPEFDPSNIFIVPPKRLPPTSQASQSGSTSSTACPTTTSKRQRTSIVWSCFTLEKHQIKKGEMVDQAVCKYCQFALSAKSNGGTRHLRRHMETCQTKHEPQDPTQTQLSQYGSRSSGITSFRYSQQHMREGLARYIAAAEQPLTFSEDERLINFLQRYCYANLEDLATPSQFQNFDILDFWMGKISFFPILSIMARDLLTPPASTVASESAFSIGGRILDEHRSRLSSETLDSLLCLKDWEDAERRVQQDWQNALIKQIESLNVDQDEVDPDYAEY
ncbi:hypothetical protein KPL70_026399 [Citrus sinensis]|nr:hypothetical protein KPL70_026399 [Citrus sinensis]